ncbi:MAG: beta-N-acetylhexosaminidase [Clostridia bacterium]|nr:beta-N-acetylhexosaminidase [Clostridia bacterium]
MITLHFSGIEERFLPGLRAFGERYGFVSGEGGLSVSVVKTGEPRLFVRRAGGDVEIGVGKPVHLFRALGLLLEQIGDENYAIAETDRFDHNGLMYDGSQASSLLTVGSCKRFLLTLAAMGLDTFLLYTENTFDLPDEPYWGYMRPRYTEADLREIDDFAYSLGIEVIPCVQTLGHLSEAIKWRPYSEFSDTPSTLLVGDERTYALCEKIVGTMSRVFRSGRIHIGLDEAWGLGRGNYLNKNGFRPVFDVMCEHLDRILAITRKYGYTPMMWGDMFVRVCQKNETDYLEGSFFEFPREIREKVPKDVQIVYWDYYNRREYYDKWIPEYKKLCGDRLIFSGCSRNVRTFGSHHTRTFLTSRDALLSCKANGVREVICTVWGDDHRESSPFAALPGVQLFAEEEYNDDPTEEAIARRFDFCAGVSYEAIKGISRFDQIEEINGDNYGVQSPSKTLLWQNILLGLFDAGLGERRVSRHYRALSRDFKTYEKKYPAYASTFAFYRALADALAIKGDIGVRITAAYRENDRAELKKIAGSDLIELEERLETLRRAHQADFYATCKPIGWEILDVRYGGAIAGARTAKTRIDDYLSGKIEGIPELEEPRRLYNGEKGLGSSMDYRRIVSASNL